MMSEKNVVLSPHDILEKEFKIDARGFNMKEVDRFLDLIINDYQAYMNEIRVLEAKISDLENDNFELKRELRNAKTKMEIINNNKDVTNIDLLKRISDLEKIVHGSR